MCYIKTVFYKTVELRIFSLSLMWTFVLHECMLPVSGCMCVKERKKRKERKREERRGEERKEERKAGW